MSTVACIIQARIGSSRLPAKTMLMLPTGRTVLAEVMWRCSQIKGIDRFVLATPVADIRILSYGFLGSVFPVKWEVAVGSETDVLSRYHMAAESAGADHIMRITADCPVLDPVICSAILSLHLSGEFDYTSNVHPRSYPMGYDCEVFTRKLLDWANEENTGLAREHVTTKMSDQGMFKIGNLSQDLNQGNVRLTLDDVDDYRVICEYLSHETSGRLPR